MTEDKPILKRVCADVPADWIKTIKDYNEGATHQINMAAVMKKALKEEVDKIKNGGE